jgi:hypothetical protein
MSPKFLPAVLMWSLFLLVVVHNVLASGMSTADHIVAAFGAQNCLSSVQCCSSGQLVHAWMDGSVYQVQSMLSLEK